MSQIFGHDIRRLAFCSVNIRRGGGLRHVANRQRVCYLCEEPLVADPAHTGYWLRWVIQEEP